MMSLDVEEINLIIKELKTKSESGWIEVKENNFTPEKVGETISALANTGILFDKEYSYMIFGIKDETWDIVGTTVNLSSLKVGNQELKLWLSTQLNPSINFEFFDNFEYLKEKLSIIKIKTISHTPVQFKKEKYIRIGSNNKKLSEFPEKERLIWEKLSSINYEEKIAMYSVNQEELFNLLDINSYYQLLKRNVPEMKTKVISDFLREKYIVESKNNMEYDITNLGALLFAKDIENFKNLARKSIRVIKYKGKNKVNIERQQIGRKGYACGFLGLVKYVNNLIPRTTEITEDRREEHIDYSPKILRELIANAIIHQDFSKTGTEVLIEFFDDRIDITNPGQPLIEPRMFYGLHRSRNESLAYHMRKFGFCEELGSGLVRIIDIAEKEGRIPPKYLTTEEFTKVTIYSHKDFDSMNTEDILNITYFHCCYKHDEGNYMTNNSLRERFKVPDEKYTKISRLLKDAINEGLIKNGPKKTYIPFWAKH